MIKVIFGARVTDAYETVMQGFVNPEKPFELRSDFTHVPTFEFEDIDSASEFVDDTLGATHRVGPALYEGGILELWADDEDTDDENEETWERFAVIKDHDVA
jgi:hypothetical protein